MHKKLTNAIYNDLLSKIQKKKANIAVLGAGYVGLPTAILFANLGFIVTILDIKSDVINNINNGTNATCDPGLQELLRNTIKDGTLRAFLSYDFSFENQDIIIVSVQTPIDKNSTPDFSFLLKAIDQIG